MSLTQLQNLLPLPQEDLKQVLDYANTLSKPAAAEHFNNLLGESPGSIEFISSFNSRRQDPTIKSNPQTQTYSQASAQSSAQASTTTGVPKSTRAPKKKKAPIHTPAPRQIQDTYAGQGTVYKKKDEDDYVSRKSTPVSSSKSAAATNSFALDSTPSAIQAPTPRPPPSAAGSLISDFGKKSKSTSSSRAASQNPSRNASPAPKTKVNITGGNAMHGASTVLNDLDAAIRTLEISTNASLSADPSKRKCNCIATRHPLLAAAPNCLNCGKVICVKEGLGPCTFCGSAILGKDEIQSMIRTLKEERGVEKQRLDASSHRRAEVSRTPAPFSAPKTLDMTPAEQKAKEHRDRLLGFQAQNAKRTTVRDEAADFDTSLATSMAVGGGSGMGGMWSSPAERARELKRQQRVLAEQEWNARPEYEKRRQVVSVDLVNGKVVKRMAKIETPKFESDGEDNDDEDVVEMELVSGLGHNGGGGTFSRNPLLGGLIKPVWSAGKGKGKETETEVEVEGDAYTRKKKTWRRVQDDMDDNEDIILDGGAFGGGKGPGKGNRREGVEEHAVGSDW